MADTGDGVVLQECTGCRGRLFPDRLRCATCGGREFRRVRVTSATVREVTLRPGAERAIATVSGGEVTMIARVPAATQVGEVLRLTRDPRAECAAFVPSRR
jgi:hypothetical protein